MTDPNIACPECGASILGGLGRGSPCPCALSERPAVARAGVDSPSLTPLTVAGKPPPDGGQPVADLCPVGPACLTHRESVSAGTRCQVGELTNGPRGLPRQP